MAIFRPNPPPPFASVGVLFDNFVDGFARSRRSVVAARVFATHVHRECFSASFVLPTYPLVGFDSGHFSSTRQKHNEYFQQCVRIVSNPNHRCGQSTTLIYRMLAGRAMGNCRRPTASLSCSPDIHGTPTSRRPMPSGVFTLNRGRKSPAGLRQRWGHTYACPIW